MIVVKAKIASDRAMIGPPRPGRVASKAAEVSAAPVAPLVQTPVDRIASAVKLQTMMVLISEPSPASLPEPKRIAKNVKAWVKIKPSACGMAPALITSTTSDARI